MENDKLRETIAVRLTYYRKRMNLTQSELAEKINYSDKSISKWERGDGVPDIYILKQLADLYGVTVNDLISEDAPVRKFSMSEKRKHALVSVLSVGLVWLVASIVLLAMRMSGFSDRLWLVWLYAIPVSAIVLIVFTSLWWDKLVQFCSVALLIWGIALCVAVTLAMDGIWFVYVVAAVVQVLEIFWFLLRLERKRRPS